jgi:predicted peroxiredoxin
MTHGTSDPLKVSLAVLTGFAMRKHGHIVDFVMMGEAGHVITDHNLRQCNGFGLPPIAKFLDDEVMKTDVTWYV